MILDKWIEFIRAIIRPYIAISGWTAFLAVVIIAVIKYLDLAMARDFIVGFITAVTTIVGVWIGGRLVKPKE